MKNSFLCKLPWLFLFLIFIQPAVAQLTISGELRPRSEFRHGFKALANNDQDAAFFTDQRTRVNLDFKTDQIETFVSLQDVRVWGNTPQLVANDGALTTLHQGWAKIKFKTNWALKLGRQELNYDDQRILGSVAWAQQARSHDAALLTFQDSTFQGHLGLAFNQSAPKLVGTLYEVPNNYKTLQFLWLNKTWGAVNASFLFLNNGLQVVRAEDEFDINFSQTIGTRIGWKGGKTVVNFATYYQSGKEANEANTKISAYYLAADIFSYIWNNKVKLGAGVEMLSGNDQLDNNDKNNAFNPFYGTNHKFNGHMDYFYVGNHKGSVGLNDIYLSSSYKATTGFNTSIMLHFLMANNNIANGSGGENDSYLGTEIDYNIGCNIAKGAKLKVGYSHMFGSDSMVAIRGGDTDAISNWAYVMVIVEPSFTFKKN